MTPDERAILQDFLGELGQARGAAKDAEADGMITDALRSNPDAAYMLVQHAILSDQALQHANQQIDQLQAQVPSGQAPAPASFLGGQSYGQAPPQSGVQGLFASNPLSSGGGLGSFMRTAGTMAAGVAAGDFLANGLSNLFGPRDW